MKDIGLKEHGESKSEVHQNIYPTMYEKQLQEMNNTSKGYLANYTNELVLS